MVRDILADTRNVLSDQSAWTRHAMERSSGATGFSLWGRPITVSRCMLGQISHECFVRGTLYGNDDTYTHATDAVRAVLRRINAIKTNGDSIATYNDTRSHSQVLRLLRVAVANLDRGGYQQRAIERKTRQMLINANVPSSAEEVTWRHHVGRRRSMDVVA